VVIDDRQLKLISLLSDGKFYSSSYLCAELSISRAAISNRVARLSVLGLHVDSVKGRGYCLRAPIELLDRVLISRSISEECLAQIGVLSVVGSTVSTNEDALNSGLLQGYGVYLSEYQTGGKGRRGKSWVQGFGSGLAVSIVKDFELGLSRLSVMSLWVAVAVCEVLSVCYGEKFKIKWPNDIYVDNQKLAGILLEAKTEVGGQVRLVTGVGINYVKEHIDGGGIDQPWVALSQLTAVDHLGRNVLLAQIIERIMFYLSRVASDDVGSDISEHWAKYDYLTGRSISVESLGGSVVGMYEGLDLQGNLMLRTDDGVISVNAGEVSVRSVAY